MIDSEASKKSIEAEELLHYAPTLRHQGHLDAALDHYNRALAITSENVVSGTRIRALIERALLFRARGQLAAALADLSAALRLIDTFSFQKHFFQPYVLYAAFLGASGDIVAAQQAYEHVIIIAHARPDPLYVVYLHGMTFDLIQIVVDCSHMLTLENSFAPAIFCRALAHRALQQWDAALADFDLAVRADNTLANLCDLQQQEIAKNRQNADLTAMWVNPNDTDKMREGVDYARVIALAKGKSIIEIFNKQGMMKQSNSRQSHQVIRSKLESQGWKPMATLTHAVDKTIYFYFQRAKGYKTNSNKRSWFSRLFGR